MNQYRKQIKYIANDSKKFLLLIEDDYSFALTCEYSTNYAHKWW